MKSYLYIVSADIFVDGGGGGIVLLELAGRGAAGTVSGLGVDKSCGVGAELGGLSAEAMGAAAAVLGVESRCVIAPNLASSSRFLSDPGAISVRFGER